MKNYSVYIYFEDGKIVCYDMNDMMEKEVFKPLKDIDVLMDTCTVMNDTLAWDISKNCDNTTCLDIDPDTLYELPFAKEKIVTLPNVPKTIFLSILCQSINHMM